MTLSGLVDTRVSGNHYCIRSFSHLKTCNNVFETVKDLRHSDDASIRVTADDVKSSKEKKPRKESLNLGSL